MAARLIEAMEEAGIVTDMGTNGQREVLASGLRQKLNPKTGKTMTKTLAYFIARSQPAYDLWAGHW